MKSNNTIIICAVALSNVAAPLRTDAQSILPTCVLKDAGVIGSVDGVNQGCIAQPSYVTGDGAGGALYTVNFNGRTAVDPDGIATYSGSFAFDTATPPSSDDSDYVSVDRGSMTITFRVQIDYFGFYWGTPDAGEAAGLGPQPTNIVTFNNVVNGVVTQMAQFTPLDISGLNDSLYSRPTGDNYVSFNATGGLTFNQVVLSTGNQGSFESDDHSYVVATASNPVPVFTTVTLSSGNLILGGTNGPPFVQFRMLTTTNLALSNSWLPVYTNNFLANGDFVYTNSSLGKLAFYRVVYP